MEIKRQSDSRIYLITGASSDVALKFISRLEDRGESCIVLGQYFSSCRELLELADKYSCVSIQPFKCDLSDADDTCRWLEYLVENFPLPTDIVHLAAGKFEYMRIRDFDWSLVEREMRIQVNAFAQIAKTFFPRMAKIGDGRVVAMLTAYTLGVPPKYLAHYVATKYALLGFVKAAASEYGSKGVRINAISPNMMETKFLDNLDSRVVEMTAKGSSMGRNVSLEEACGSIEYLLSPESAYLNGINLNLTGGDRM